MPKFDPTLPRAEVTFQCRACRKTFTAAPARVVEKPDQADHPFEYFAPCPRCDGETPQAFFDRNLQKAWLNATGPKTAEGKAAAAANGKGHPTPEEALRTRYNAMKTGMHARTATYFPARPDKYSFCEGCEVDRTWCAEQPACVKQTEIFMLHHAAFDQRDPAKLKPIYSDLHAAVFATLQRILQTIIVDGVKITTPEYYTDKEGKMILAKYYDESDRTEKQIFNLEAHPLFKPLGELMSKLNLSLADMGMTVKVIDQQDEEMGQLAGAPGREALEDFGRRIEHGIAQLGDKMDRAQLAKSRDPVLLEHNAESGVATVVPE